jgi:hypothetical protein
LSITIDAPARPGSGWDVGPWRRLVLCAVLSGGLGYAVGHGVALTRAGDAPPADVPLMLAAHAIAEAHLARTSADLAIEIDRLSQVRRDDALLRAGLALHEALRADGPPAATLAAMLAVEGAAQALATLRADLPDDIAGLPDRPGLAAQLDAVALSVLALGMQEPEVWSTRMVRRIGELVGTDGHAARQQRRQRAFDGARQAAAVGDLATAIVALDELDAEAAAVLAGWVDAARQRMARDALADRVAASVMAHAYR